MEDPRARPPAATSTAATAHDALAEEIWQFGLDESPINATFLGDRRGDGRLDERGPAARQRRAKKLAEFSARLAALPPAPPETETALTQRVLERWLADAREEDTHHFWEHEVDQIFGLHLQIVNVLALQPLETPQDLELVLARIGAIPACLAQWEGDLRDGLASGRVPPREGVSRVLKQLEGFAFATPDRSPFAVPATRLPAGWSEADRAKATTRIHEAVQRHARPALARIHKFFESELAPKARGTPGIAAIPGGAAAYAFRVRQSTTTDLTPKRIHEIGLEELDGNRREMLAVARSLGHRGDLKTFLKELKDDRRFRLAKREEILARYRAICARMDKRLPELFGRLPKTPYEVKAVEAYREKDSTAAFYQPPPEDRSRGGIYYANTNDPSSWPTYEFEPLCFHEAVPGHHLQIALAQETPGLPSLRRHGGFTAYVEGWAHYTERLADEIGMYSTPHDRIGMLSAQAWRAARLVVDTGLHALGWSRAQAVEVLSSIRAGATSDIENEVDRYIIWPGQALAYKIGSRTILELRERTKARLGPRFTLKGFHDEVLRHGALPLALLEEVVGRWQGAAA
jgi:uncharacterized protein (DUF885 family)